MLEVNPSEMGGDVLTEQTYGQMLKNAREAQGMSVEEAASKLRLSNKQIIGIENCEPEVFATTVYARGHIKRYAHLLQLDENQVISVFNRTLSKADKKLQSFISKSSSVPVTSQSRQSQAKKSGKQKGWGKIIFILLIILVCILAWLYVQKGFFPDSADDGYNRITEENAEEQLGSEPVYEAPVEEIAKEDAAAETLANTDQVNNEPVAEDDAVADIINRQEQQEQQEQLESSEPEEQTEPQEESEQPAAEPAAEEAPAAAAATEASSENDRLSIRRTNSGFQVTVGTNRAKECTMIFEATNGDCWFGVYKDDQLAGAASLKAGQTRTLTNTLPLKISMGNPVAAKVQLNGQEVDLSRAQRLGITNFTVLSK